MDLIGTTDRLIDAPPAAVWERLADVGAWRAWMPNVRWAVLEGELAPGSYVTIKPERGRQTAYRVDAAAAPLLLSLGLTFGPVAALQRTFELSPEGGGTRITQRVAIGGPLRAWLVRAPAARLHDAGAAVLEALANAIAAA
jgi:uncharacterized protein YndB with AHSA1/START domain